MSDIKELKAVYEAAKSKHESNLKEYRIADFEANKAQREFNEAHYRNDRATTELSESNAKMRSADDKAAQTFRTLCEVQISLYGEVRK